MEKALEMMPADGCLLETLASIVVDTKPWKRPDVFVPKIAEAFAASLTPELPKSTEAAFFLLCRGCTSTELWELMLELGRLGALEKALVMVQGKERIVSAQFMDCKPRPFATICRIKNGVEIRRPSGGMVRILKDATPLSNTELQKAAMTKWVSCG